MRCARVIRTAVIDIYARDDVTWIIPGACLCYLVYVGIVGVGGILLAEPIICCS